MMAGLVCVTIKKTKRLHRPHNFLVANVMVADIVLSLWSVLPATISLIGAATGKDLNHCGLINIAFHPVITYHITFLMISIDKVIAIASPYKHQHIMTHRVVAGMICASWLLAIIISFHTLFVHRSTYLQPALWFVSHALSSQHALVQCAAFSMKIRSCSCIN